MHDGSLGSVISSLELWEVDDMPAHGGSSDEAAVGEVLQLLAVDIGSITLLPSPDGSTRAGAVEGTVDVGGHDLAVVVDGALDDGALGPGNSRVGDEDIEAAIELLDDLLNGGLDFLRVLDVDLVCSAYTPERIT